MFKRIASVLFVLFIIVLLASVFSPQADASPSAALGVKKTCRVFFCGGYNSNGTAKYNTTWGGFRYRVGVYGGSSLYVTSAAAGWWKESAFGSSSTYYLKSQVY